jgi:ACS family hexuronate transporter-like MFS transporter
VAYSGGSLGAIVTPLVVTPIALVWGWRAAFLFTGAIGVAWLLLWSLVSRRPDVRKLPAPAETEPTNKRMHVRDPRIWSFGILYALGALPIAFVIYSAPIYLSKVLGASQARIGQVLWLPPLGWEIGYFFWGWLADRAKAVSANRLPALRRLLLIATVFSLPLAAVPSLNSFPLAMATFVLAMFCAAGFIILSIAYATDVYSSRYAGLISGLSAGAWSAAVAVIMPIFGRLFDQQAYGAAFLLAATCPVVAFLVWRLTRNAPRPEPSHIAS